MRNAAVFFAILIGAAAIAACSTGRIDREMKLSNPAKRSVNDEPGTNINAQRSACADRMLNLSPATEAKDVDVRVLSQDQPVVIEVDAVLLNFGSYGRERPVTYHCEYLGGALSLGKWTRGLTESGK